MRPLPWLAASVILLSLGSSAVAAPDDTTNEELVVVLKNGKGKDGKPKGCFFSAKGKTKPLMDGTRLVVTLAARGRSRDFPVKILRAVVKDNAFEVSYPWPDRVFAPLLYQVKVELKVRKQARPIQNWIMTEYGYAPSHQELVDQKLLSFGGDEVRAAFAIKNIAYIKSLVHDLDARRLRFMEMAQGPAAETEGWPATYTLMKKELIHFRDLLDRYFRQYVVLLEQGFSKRLHEQMIALNRILRDHDRARPGTQERLVNLGKDLEASIELIKQYEPVPTDEPLIPEDSDEGGR